jgi:hypothetical protein
MGIGGTLPPFGHPLDDYLQSPERFAALQPGSTEPLRRMYASGPLVRSWPPDGSIKRPASARGGQVLPIHWECEAGLP